MVLDGVVRRSPSARRLAEALARVEADRAGHASILETPIRTDA